MVIAVPKEIKEQEYRVALTPHSVFLLTKQGHHVIVESGAGIGTGYPDDAYQEAGASIESDHAKLFEKGELLVKVKEPQPSEIRLLQPGQILFTYLHLAADRSLTQALLDSGVTALAYETLEVNHSLPLLEPMSEIAGRMSIVAGSYFLAKPYSGSGVLLPGVPGVLRGKVVILGGGISGVNAAQMAIGIGAQVIVMEIDQERMRFLDFTLHSVHTYYSTEAHLRELLPSIDLLIGSVLVPGARTPKLVSRDMLGQMRPGSVLVDISVDQGGCVETSRPTTHADPIFIEDGITHYCVANMPGAYARTATQALTNATTPYIQRLADHGLQEACRHDRELVSSVNIHDGKLTYRAVAEAHDLPYTEPDGLF